MPIASPKILFVIAIPDVIVEEFRRCQDWGGAAANARLTTALEVGIQDGLVILCQRLAEVVLTGCENDNKLIGQRDEIAPGMAVALQLFDTGRLRPPSARSPLQLPALLSNRAR